MDARSKYAPTSPNVYAADEATPVARARDHSGPVKLVRGAFAVSVIEARQAQGIHLPDDERALAEMRQSQRLEHVRAVSALGAICSNREHRDPFSAAAMPRDSAQAFLRKVFVLFMLQQLCSVGLVLVMILDKSPANETFKSVFHPKASDWPDRVAELWTMPVRDMLLKYDGSIPAGNLCRSGGGDSVAATAACAELRESLVAATLAGDGAIPPLVGAGVAVLITLSALFFTKYLWPVNYLILLVFTVAQSFFFGGLSLFFGTVKGLIILIFAALFTIILALLLLCIPWCSHGASHRFLKATLLAYTAPIAALIACQLRYSLLSNLECAGVSSVYTMLCRLRRGAHDESWGTHD